MIAYATAALMEAASGELWRTSEHRVVNPPAWSAPPVSQEGQAVLQQVHRVVVTLERPNVELATASSDAALRLAPAVPESWLGLARAVFPNSHAMTREERREFEQGFWSDLEPIDFPDE